MFMKTNDLIFGTHDVYENKATWIEPRNQKDDGGYR